MDIPNFSGPLEVLLDLARNQKVDLAEISVATLAVGIALAIAIKRSYNTIEDDEIEKLDKAEEDL